MPIPLIGPAGLFTRLGKLGATLQNFRNYQATQEPALIDTTTGAVAQYDAESDLQAVIGNNYVGILNSGSGLISLMQQLAQITISRMVFRDQPQFNQTLTQQNLEASLTELLRQMNAASATVRAQTVTATPTVFTGQGNGIIVGSVKTPLTGVFLENAFAENILFNCTADSYTGGTAVGNEQFTVTGTGNQADFLAFDWPMGSNGQLTLTAVNGADSASGGNSLVNSDFADWTDNIPDNFTLEVGTAGTNIVREASIVYTGTYSLALVGDGSTLTQLNQLFNDDTGSTVSLTPLTQYAFNFFIRRDGSAPGAGILQIALVDENDNVVQDYAGTANSFTVDLTTLNTTFTSYTGVFRTPEEMPETISLRVKLTTVLSAGRTVYLDLMGMTPMDQLYEGGPFFSIFSGSVPFLFGDYSYCPVTNSRGAGGTLNTWQSVFSILLGDPTFLLPSATAGSETILDSLLS